MGSSWTAVKRRQGPRVNQSVYLLRSPAASTDDLEVAKKNVWHLFYVSEDHVVRVRI